MPFFANRSLRMRLRIKNIVDGKTQTGTEEEQEEEGEEHVKWILSQNMRLEIFKECMKNLN